ncbi:MAG: cation:proton antiporter [Nocardioidaceae bacterium]|nr:cation:proton antiporter [Nocardioidaceae bacterium]NUS49973.1 cation:proton antiporter [Nocardioidaceae bacterium]
MLDTGLDNLFLVTLVALLAPLAVGLLPALRVPAVVVEIVAGVVLGPSVLGLVEVDVPVQVLSVLGLAFLLFMVGLQLDVRQLRGELLRVAAVGYLVTLVLGSLVGVGVAAAGWVSDPLLVAVALSATSLGLVVPVLKDAGRVDTDLGRTTLAAATLADLAAVLLLTLLFSTGTTTAGARVVLLVTFAGLVALTIGAVLFAERWSRLSATVLRLQDTTAEIRVRAAVVLLVGFVVLAERLGLETILGALLAGAVIAAVDRDAASHPHFRTKLEAIGFGFLVPVFFVSSGLQLDVAGLVQDPAALARTPVFLVALLLVRGLPALLLRHRLSTRETVAAGLLQATSLPFLVTASMIGVEIGLLSAVTAAALVAAGIVSVLVFPTAALSLLGTARPEPERVPETLGRRPA